MTIHCPCCRASGDGPICRRCKADLTLLMAVEARRQFLVEEACFALGERDVDLAEASLNEAVGLRAGADVAQLRAITALLKRDYAGAISPPLRFGEGAGG